MITLARKYAKRFGAMLVVTVGVLAGSTAPTALATSASIPAATPVDAVTAAAPCPYDGGHPTLRQGDSGEAVAHLQCLLRNVWGYTITVDSQFGPITRSTVMSHQRDCNIVVDGVVGPDTWRHLHPDTTTPACLD